MSRANLPSFCALLVLMSCSIFLSGQNVTATTDPGRSIVRVKAQTNAGPKDLDLYKSNRALLIGVSDYTAGWQDLESVPRELNEVAKVIKDQGFKVEKHLNPDGKQLENIFEKFIDDYGYDPDARLLFYFSGHGYTRSDGEKGYLVPADAPDPEKDDRGFLRKALSMDQIGLGKGNGGQARPVFV